MSSIPERGKISRQFTVAEIGECAVEHGLRVAQISSTLRELEITVCDLVTRGPAGADDLAAFRAEVEAARPAGMVVRVTNDR